MYIVFFFSWLSEPAWGVCMVWNTNTVGEYYSGHRMFSLYNLCNPLPWATALFLFFILMPTTCSTYACRISLKNFSAVTLVLFISLVDSYFGWHCATNGVWPSCMMFFGYLPCLYGAGSSGLFSDGIFTTSCAGIIPECIKYCYFIHWVLP